MAGTRVQRRHSELLQAQLWGDVSGVGENRRQWRSGSTPLSLAETAEERILGVSEDYVEFYQGIDSNVLHDGRIGTVTILLSLPLIALNGREVAGHQQGSRMTWRRV